MPICPGCQQPIVDSSITALDRSWHSVCFRCTGCGQPIGQHHFFSHANQPYHEACFHARFSPRCAIGGEVLHEWVINGWGETYCKAHATGLAECFSCHRPVCVRLTGGGVFSAMPLDMRSLRVKLLHQRKKRCHFRFILVGRSEKGGEHRAL